MSRSARFAFGAALAGVLLALASVPGGAAFTDRFDALEAELVTRRDVDLAGELDKAGKKQLKAVVKSLAFIAKEADDLGDDLKTAGKVSRFLQKAFPPLDGPAVLLDPVDGFLETILDGLQGDVEAGLAELRGRIPGLTAKGAAKADKFADKADEALAALDLENLPVRAKGLTRAWKFTGKGVKAADRDPGAPQILSLTVDGTTYQAGEIVIFFDSTTGLLNITATGESPAFSMNISPPPGVDGVGEFSIETAQVAILEEPPLFYSAFSGTLVLGSIDPERRRMEGTFAFTGEGDQGTEGTVEITGSFEATYDGP